MWQSRFALRLLVTLAVAVPVGYWAGSSTSNEMERRVLADYGATDLTQVPEYQGIGAGQLMCGAIVFLLVGSLTAAVTWRLARPLFVPPP